MHIPEQLKNSAVGFPGEGRNLFKTEAWSHALVAASASVADKISKCSSPSCLLINSTFSRRTSSSPKGSFKVQSQRLNTELLYFNLLGLQKRHAELLNLFEIAWTANFTFLQFSLNFLIRSKSARCGIKCPLEYVQTLLFPTIILFVDEDQSSWQSIRLSGFLFLQKLSYRDNGLL